MNPSYRKKDGLKSRRRTRVEYLLALFILPSMLLTISFQKDALTEMQKTTERSSSVAIKRAVLCFFPTSQASHFIVELRWLAKSWEWMQEYEDHTLVTTDFIVVTNNITEELVAAFPHCEVRENNSTAFRDEKHPEHDPDAVKQLQQQKSDDRFPGKCILIGGYVNLEERMSEFQNYKYADSIGVVGYIATTLLAYDLVIRTDMDCFLTPAMASFLPKLFVVGRGGYASEFANHRLRRVQQDTNMSANKPIVDNIGSTWYGDAKKMVECAELTVHAMRYLQKWEFVDYERKHWNSWPEWHFGVLSLYGGHIAINYCLQDVGFEKRPDMMDYGADDHGSVWEHAHLHTWHSRNNFSKFVFREGGYKDVNVSLLNRSKISDYSLAAAMEANYVDGKLIPYGLGSVSCGSHTARSCDLCPQGNGAGWCNGECNWDTSTGKCVSRT